MIDEADKIIILHFFLVSHSETMSLSLFLSVSYLRININMLSN